METKGTSVNVRISEELHERLQEDADRSERTVAQTVRLALKEYLGRQATAA
jgi:predicted transcriptional regulator